MGVNLGATTSTKVEWQSNAPGIAEGLKSYPNNELGLVQIKDCRPTDIKVRDAAQSILNHGRVISDRCMWRFEARNAAFPRVAHLDNDTYAYPAESLPWNSSEESNGLYFFIHGLEGSPADWNAYKDDLLEDSMSHVFAPEVMKRGNCGLEAAGKPLLEALESYLTKFPGKPVTLIGTSNGGRLAATYLEANLPPEVLGSSTLTVVSLAGVHYGTKFMDYMMNPHVLPLVLDKQLLEEFRFGSESARKHLFAWKAKQDVWNAQNKKVHHLFCATTEDAAVRDNSSSLPYHESSSSKYIVVSGQSHTSIVDALRKDVMQWLKLHRS